MMHHAKSKELVFDARGWECGVDKTFLNWCVRRLPRYLEMVEHKQQMLPRRVVFTIFQEYGTQSQRSLAAPCLW